MKRLVVFIIFLTLIANHDCRAQSLNYGTISLCGGEFSLSDNKGGYTVGEVAVASFNGSVNWLEGFQFIQTENIYPGCLLVNSILPNGEGTLRAAVECAEANDVIVFDPSLSNQILFLDLPAITINKPLTLQSATGNVNLRNLNVTNTDPLLIFAEDVTVKGVIFSGGNNGMIVEIQSPFTVTWKQ